jgi:hypothetical protein
MQSLGNGWSWCPRCGAISNQQLDIFDKPRLTEAARIFLKEGEREKPTEAASRRKK